MDFISDGLATLFRSSFGSDELTHYTAEYTWLANQMAHAMMGFFLAAVWTYLVAIKNWKWYWLGLPFALLIAKEVIDMTYDAKRFAGSPFDADRWNLVFDSITDLFFWWLGMALAGPFFYFDLKNPAQRRRFFLWLVGTIVVGAGVALWWGSIWVKQKRTFDHSGMPFNYVRLVDLTLNSARPDPQRDVRLVDRNEAIKVIQSFQAHGAGGKAGRAQWKNYIVYGGDPVERSRLAVSLGCEYAFRSMPIYYIPAARGFEYPKLFEHPTMPYKAGEIECVVIDDLDTSAGMPPGFSIGDQIRALGVPVPALVAGLAELPRVDASTKRMAQAEVERSAKPAAEKEQEHRRIEQEARQEEFRKLIAAAREHRITTVWVLAGEDGALRQRWVGAITRLLDGGTSPSPLPGGSGITILEVVGQSGPAPHP